FGGMRKMAMSEFKDWLAKGDTRKPVSITMRRRAERKKEIEKAAATQPKIPPDAEWPRKGKKINTRNRKKAIDEYYTPGNIIESYGGGHDRVISFDPKAGAITVEAVEQNDGQWVTAGEQRVHSTLPEDRALIRGPVDMSRKSDNTSPSPTEPIAQPSTAI